MSLFPLLSEMDIRHGHGGDEAFGKGSFLTKLPAWGSRVGKWDGQEKGDRRGKAGGDLGC